MAAAQHLAGYHTRSCNGTWFLAASPIRRSESVKATYEGVVRLPMSLAIISTRSFCQTPTHLRHARCRVTMPDHAAYQKALQSS